MAKRFETSDGRYYTVAVRQWWDTTGIEIVPQEVVDRYLAANPDVGIVVLPLGELPDEGDSGKLN